MKNKKLKEYPDDMDIKVNTVWDVEKGEYVSEECDGRYDEKANTFYITPNSIVVPEHPLIADEIYRKHISASIIDVFEDILEEKDITIPDVERKGDADEARIYGDSYYRLEDGIDNILKNS